MTTTSPRRRRDLMWNATADAYRRLLRKAARVLSRQLDEVYQPTSFRAAYAVLQTASRFRPLPDPPGPDQLPAPPAPPAPDPDAT